MKHARQQSIAHPALARAAAAAPTRTKSALLSLAVASVAILGSACVAEEDAVAPRVAASEICSDPIDDERGLLTLYMDEETDWDGESMTVMTESNAPFSMYDDGKHGDDVAGDGVFTAVRPATPEAESVCAPLEWETPSEYTDRGIAFGCSVEYVEEGGTSENCSGVCDDPLDLGCVCFYDCYVEVSIF